MTSWRRVVVGSATALLVGTTASSVLAQTKPAPPPVATVKAIDSFKEAVALFERGEIAPACRAFERSYAEDAAPGTLYNLAVCHAKEGRTADAYAELDSLARRAASTGRPDKAAALDARAATLRPQLARVTLTHPAHPRSAVLAVSIDDAPLVADEWTRPLYVAPREHVFHFRYADGSESRRTTTALRPGSSTEVLLEEPAEADLPVGGPAGDGEAATAPSLPAGRRVAVYATGAAGAALLGAGIVLGLRTFAERDDAESQCQPGGGCRNQGQYQAAYDDRHDARIAATLSTVAFIGSGAALGASVLLFLTGKRQRGSSAGAMLLPSAGAHGPELLLSGRF